MNFTVRLLHLEDDEDCQKLLEVALRAHTHRVVVSPFTFAVDALQYLRALDAHSYPDLIVADLHLPGMSGYEFIETMRGEPFGKVPAVVFTSSASPDDEAFCASRGIDMLTKPGSIRDWEELVGWMLSTKLRR